MAEIDPLHGLTQEEYDALDEQDKGFVDAATFLGIDLRPREMLLQVVTVRKNQ